MHENAAKFVCPPCRVDGKEKSFEDVKTTLAELTAESKENRKHVLAASRLDAPENFEIFMPGQSLFKAKDVVKPVGSSAAPKIESKAEKSDKAAPKTETKSDASS